MEGESGARSQGNLSDVIRSLDITPVVNGGPLKGWRLLDPGQRMHLTRWGCDGGRDRYSKTQGAHVFLLDRDL